MTYKLYKRERERLKRIEWISSYINETGVKDKNKLLRIIMNRWGGSRRLALEYLFALDAAEK